MDNAGKEIFKVKYEVVTPIHVGNGQKIPKTELAFFPDKGLIRRVDFEKFIETIPPHKIKDISQKLRYAKNDFFNYILKSESLSLDNLSTEYDLLFLYNYKLNEITKMRELSSHIKSIFSKPYLPGSSIKGWLRTAILHYYIKRIKEAKPLIDNFYRQLDRLPSNPRQLRKEKGKMGSILEKQVFGQDPREDIFKFVTITDTESISKKYLGLAIVQIFHPLELKENVQFQSLKFSQYLEVIKIKSHLEGKIVFNKDFQGYKNDFFKSKNLSTQLREHILKDLIGLPRDECFTKIKEICNIFSKQIISFNLKYLKKLKEEIKSSNLLNLIQYYDTQLIPLYEELKSSKNQFLIRLGAGTEWHSKTVGLLIMDYFLKHKGLDFNQFYNRINRLQLFKGQRMHKKFELAPISRTYVVDSMQIPQFPLGWVKVQLKV